MLAKQTPAKSEGQMGTGNELKEDIRIASAILTDSFLSEEGEPSLVAALSSPEPAKAVGIIVAQVIEMTQTETMQTPVPMNAEVWFMEDGAIDDSAGDIESVAGKNGIELPEDFIEQVIDETMAVLMKRKESMAQEEQAGGGQPPQPNGPAPVPNGMGGMPNGMG